MSNGCYLCHIYTFYNDHCVEEKQCFKKYKNSYMTKNKKGIFKNDFGKSGCHPCKYSLSKSM